MTPAGPFWAELADMADALERLGTRPLKLVAEAVQPAYGEAPWDGGRWEFKQLLAVPSDIFQFSVAGPGSKQDFHFHEGVFEIYASEHAMEIEYRDGAGGMRHATVREGVLLVPPKLAHRVTLHGLTFVFQAAIGGQVHGDKTCTQREE